MDKARIDAFAKAAGITTSLTATQRIEICKVLSQLDYVAQLRAALEWQKERAK